MAPSLPFAWGIFPTACALVDTEKALEDHNQKPEQSGIHFYIDGSGIEHKGDAAAICIDNLRLKTSYMGLWTGSLSAVERPTL